MSYKHNCSVHGHNFIGRYDKKLVHNSDKTSNYPIVAESIYIRDVCTYCGKIIERKK